MSLSDKELLLLDCFMYSDIAPKSNGKSINDIYETYSKNGKPLTAADLDKVQFSGDMDAEKMADVINQMHNDPKMNSLRIDGVTPEYKGSIRGACFVDEKGNATVAFRGTGGSFDQWYGNTEAYGDVSNNTQDAAVDFINSLPYNNIEVTGHSNGANMAMFVTIVCSGKKIKKCKCFEGEGFSDEFCEKYKDEIKQKRGKIEQVSAYNDPIHRILKRVAGKEKYVNGGKGPFSHGCYNILKNNDFDKNGNFSSDCYRNESSLWAWVDLTEKLADWSDIPIVGSTLEYTADFLGIIAGLVFDRKDIDAWKKGLTKLVESFVGYKINLIVDVVNVLDKIYKGIENTIKKIEMWLYTQSSGYKYATANPYIDINTTTMKQYAVQLRTLSSRSKKLDGKMNSLYWHLGIEWDTIANLGRLLKAEVILDFAGRLDKCATYLEKTADDFNNVEDSLLNI